MVAEPVDDSQTSGSLQSGSERDRPDDSREIGPPPESSSRGSERDLQTAETAEQDP